MHVPYDWRCRTNPLGSYEHELGNSDGVRESVRGEMFFGRGRSYEHFAVSSGIRASVWTTVSHWLQQPVQGVASGCDDVHCVAKGGAARWHSSDRVIAQAFVSRLVGVGFVVDNVTLRQGFLQVLQLSPVSIIRPALRTRLHPLIALIRTNGQNLGIFKKHWCFVNRRTLNRKTLLTWVLRQYQEVVERTQSHFLPQVILKTPRFSSKTGNPLAAAQPQPCGCRIWSTAI